MSVISEQHANGAQRHQAKWLLTSARYDWLTSADCKVERVVLEAEDEDDSDSDAGSGGGGMQDYPAEEFPEPPQWWQ